jgi:hypothetical protein
MPNVGRLLESQFLRFCVAEPPAMRSTSSSTRRSSQRDSTTLRRATISFFVAAGSNYVWNRTWTFQTSEGPLLGQGARALLVSGLSLGANQLFLIALVSAGATHLVGQAVAVDPRHSVQLRREQAVGICRVRAFCPRGATGAGSGAAPVAGD